MDVSSPFVLKAYFMDSCVHTDVHLWLIKTPLFQLLCLWLKAPKISQRQRQKTSQWHTKSLSSEADAGHKSKHKLSPSQPLTCITWMAEAQVRPVEPSPQEELGLLSKEWPLQTSAASGKHLVMWMKGWGQGAPCACAPCSPSSKSAFTSAHSAQSIKKLKTTPLPGLPGYQEVKKNKSEQGEIWTLCCTDVLL